MAFLHNDCITHEPYRALWAERQRLVEALRQAEERYNSLRDQHQLKQLELERKCSELSYQVVGLDEDNTKLKDQVRSLQGDNKSLNKRIRQYQADVSHLEAEVAQYKTQVASLRVQINELQTQLAMSDGRHEQNVVSLKSEIDVLKEQQAAYIKDLKEQRETERRETRERIAVHQVVFQVESAIRSLCLQERPEDMDDDTWDDMRNIKVKKLLTARCTLSAHDMKSVVKVKQLINKHFKSTEAYLSKVYYLKDARHFMAHPDNKEKEQYDTDTVKKLIRRHVSDPRDRQAVMSMLNMLTEMITDDKPLAGHVASTI